MLCYVLPLSVTRAGLCVDPTETYIYMTDLGVGRDMVVMFSIMIA
jgi:hypothetical protein